MDSHTQFMLVSSLIHFLMFSPILIPLYLLPSLVAACRWHPQRRAIFALNLLVGLLGLAWIIVSRWQPSALLISVLGWIVPFVWALTSPSQASVTPGVTEAPSPRSIEI